MTIASRYPTYKEQWQQAAATLRQPYWNRGSKPLLPDQIISQGTLTIETPEGWRTVQNPFLFYRFHPICEDFPPDANKYPTTLRYPTTHDSDAKSNVKSLKKYNIPVNCVAISLISFLSLEIFRALSFPGTYIIYS